MAKEQTTKLDDQIIVRMTSETKDKFMARVKSEGKTASEVIMAWVQDYLSQQPQESPNLNQMKMEIEFLKQQVTSIQDELVGKSVA